MGLMYTIWEHKNGLVIKIKYEEIHRDLVFPKCVTGLVRGDGVGDRTGGCGLGDRICEVEPGPLGIGGLNHKIQLNKPFTRGQGGQFPGANVVIPF